MQYGHWGTVLLHQGGGGSVWSPTFHPADAALDRHGMGYTVFETAKDGLAAELAFFVPIGENFEVQRVTLHNETNATKALWLTAARPWRGWAFTTNIRYGKTIVITENGQSCNDQIFLDGKVHDPERIDFLHRYLLELKKGIDEGAPVLGYLQWSFLDNFDWSQGYDERFGLIFVDYRTGERIPKDSGYAKVIETNGVCL